MNGAVGCCCRRVRLAWVWPARCWPNWCWPGAWTSPGGQLDATGLAQPDDELAARVLGVLASEQPPRPVADWLAFLARTAPADVAGRLERAGYLVAAPALPWRAARWRPADPDCAFAPVTRVKSALSPGRPADVQDLALAGLAAACGLGARLATYLPPGSRARMDAGRGPARPGPAGADRADPRRGRRRVTGPPHLTPAIRLMSLELIPR